MDLNDSIYSSDSVSQKSVSESEDSSLDIVSLFGTGKFKFLITYI